MTKEKKAKRELVNRIQNAFDLSDKLSNEQHDEAVDLLDRMDAQWCLSTKDSRALTALMNRCGISYDSIRRDVFKEFRV